MNRADVTQAPTEPLTEQEIEALPLFQDGASILALTALGLLAVFLFTMLGIPLPLQWIDPSWQMAQIERLIRFSGLPLLALALLVIAARQDGAGPWIQDSLAHCRSLARLVCCGYLLVIPLQFVAATVVSQHLAVASPPPIRALTRTQEAIAASTSLEDLQETLRGLPPSLRLRGADLNQGTLPVVRLELQRQLNRQIQALGKESQERRNLQRLNDLVTTLRVTAVSLILSMIYSGVAMGRPERGSWLQQLAWARERRQEARRERLRARLELQAEMAAIRLHDAASDWRPPGDGSDPAATLQAPRSGPWPWSRRVDPDPGHLTGAHADDPGDDEETQDVPAVPPTTRRDPPAAAAWRQGRWPKRHGVDDYLEELAEAAASAELDTSPAAPSTTDAEATGNASRRGRRRRGWMVDPYMEQLADAAAQEEDGRNRACDDHAGGGV